MPDAKDYILYIFISMKCPEKANELKKKKKVNCLGLKIGQEVD